MSNDNRCFLENVDICSRSLVRDGKRCYPYWRVVKDGGKLNDKFPDGIKLHADLLESEGHSITKSWQKRNKLPS